MKTSRFLSLLITGCLILNSANAFAFNDNVEKYTTSIEYLSTKGVIVGYGADDYQPERDISLAEFFKIILANYDFEPEEITRYTHPFEDIDNENDWFAPYIEKAWEIGLLDKTTELNPHKTITRVQALKYALNFMGIPMPKLINETQWTLNFPDVRFNAWYAPSILYGVSYGLLEPLDTQNNYFRPFTNLTRGEATELAYNMDTYLFGNGLIGTNIELENAIFDGELEHSIPHLDILIDVWDRMHDDYWQGSEIDETELIYDAVKGLVDGLDDPYSTFFDPPEASTYESHLEGEFGGIGAYLEVHEEGGVVISNFVIDSPAESYGLKVNDRIIGVDGLDIQTMNIYEIGDLIRGESGTSVDLTVERQGESFTFSVTRGTIDIGFMSGEIIDDNIIYVDFNLFDSMSFAEFYRTVSTLIEENPEYEGFIFDLRDNPGGYLDSVISILGHFIPWGEPLVYLSYDERTEVQISNGKSEWANTPTVILVNEQTASAAEIMAIALQEKNNASLVGQTTYGKGLVQEILEYYDGSYLKLTIAEWKSPNYNSINEIGITPDYEIEMTLEDHQDGEDPQLDMALEVLQDKIDAQTSD
jgi:carboxyl-terminal processing protease